MLRINAGKSIKLDKIYKRDVCQIIKERADQYGKESESITIHFLDNAVQVRDSRGNPYDLPGYRFNLVSHSYDKAKIWSTEPLVNGYAELPPVNGKPAQDFIYTLCGLIASHDYNRNYAPYRTTDGVVELDYENIRRKCSNNINECPYSDK